MRNEHDDAVDKVLAALRDAAPPEGMNARIAQRLAQDPSPAPDAAFHWRDMFAGSALAGAWWRGAISGAAAAGLVAGIVMFAGHPARTHTAQQDHAPIAVRDRAAVRDVSQNAAPVRTSAESAPEGEVRGKPCASPGMLRVRSMVPAKRSEMLLAASFERSHPAPGEPLTAQERALLQLARSTDPKVLATLASQTQAKVEQDSATEFEKFFAPPARP